MSDGALRGVPAEGETEAAAGGCSEGETSPFECLSENDLEILFISCYA
jgi:hypothetical protein